MMKYTTIPHTDIEVSSICLGTMTWGNQNTQEEGFEQMDYSLSEGVNFFDTAELYPVPANADTYAETERIIGNWFATRNNREQVVFGHQNSRSRCLYSTYPQHWIFARKHPSGIGWEFATTQDRLHRFIPVALARAQFQFFWNIGVCCTRE